MPIKRKYDLGRTTNVAERKRLYRIEDERIHRGIINLELAALHYEPDDHCL